MFFTKLPRLIILLVLGADPHQAQEQKLQVPDAANQKKAEGDIRGVFKDEFSKKDRESRRALGQKLLAQAGDAANTPATRYTVLIMARDVSAEALDFKTGFAAIDALEQSFDVRPAPLTGAVFSINLNLLKAHYLIASRKYSLTPEDISVVAGWFTALAEKSLAAGDYDDAGSFADQAGKTTKDPSVLSKAKQVAQEVPGLKAERDAAAKAEATIGKNPDDPEANLALGRYLLFVKKDEPAALSCLRKGSSPAWRDVATAELAKPGTPEAMLEVGEGWLGLGDKEKSTVGKARCQERAIVWLERGFLSAGGLTKAKIKKKLSDLGRIEEPSAEGLLGRWFFDEGSGTTTQDSSGKGHTGTLMNGVKWVNGLSGGALSFDGAGSYVSCLAGGLHFADTPQTMAWAHLVLAQPKGSVFVIAQTSEKSSLVLGFGYRDGKITVWHTNATLVQAPAPPPGEWHFYAYTYDQKTHKLYVDGVLKASSAGGTMAGQYQMLEFGRWYGGYPVANSPPNQFFQGALDDVRLYGRALEEAEMRDLVRRKKP
jgi:hypothetical protein